MPIFFRILNNFKKVKKKQNKIVSWNKKSSVTIETGKYMYSINIKNRVILLLYALIYITLLYFQTHH